MIKKPEFPLLLTQGNPHMAEGQPKSTEKIPRICTCKSLG
jgi:hypothetical protein